MRFITSISKKHYYIIVVIILFSSFKTENQFIWQLADQLVLYNQKNASHKIHLHFDRNNFNSGDELLFKAYAVEQNTNNLLSDSDLLFVSLLDNNGQIITENRWNIEGGVFNGGIDIPDSLERGVYTIAAYTAKMKNFDPENIFLKDINIIDLDSANINFDFIINSTENQLKVDVSLRSSNEGDIAGRQVTYQVNKNGQILLSGTTKSNKEGKCEVDLSQLLGEEEDYFLEVNTNLKEKSFNDYIQVSKDLLNIDLQFFPEGGNLIAETQNRVAFKAVDKNGNPIDISGKLVDSNGLEMNTVSSYYKGMGAFELTPEYGKSYSIRIADPNGGFREYELPEINETGIALIVNHLEGDSLSVLINGGTDFNDKRYYALLRSGDKLCYAQEISKNVAIQFSAKDLPTGIAQLTIFDELERPVAERLVFLNKNKKLTINVNVQKPYFKKREKIQAIINVSDELGNPCAANLSLSAVGEKWNYERKQSENIISNLLLQSELRGRIPTPNYYFNDETDSTKKALDLVMMTNGWRKVTWKELIDKNWQNDNNRVDNLYLSGFLKNRKGELIQNSELQAVNLKKFNMADIKTDDNGQFFIPKEFIHANSNGFMITTPNSKKNKYEIELNSESESEFAHNVRGISSTYSEEVQRKSFQFINSMEAILQDEKINLVDAKLLDEIEINSNKIDREELHEQRKKFHPLNNSSFKKTTLGEDIDCGNTDFPCIIKQAAPSARVIFYRFNAYYILSTRINFPAMLVVDDVFLGYWTSNLIGLDLSSIESVDVYDGTQAAALYGSRGKGGVISIRTFIKSEKETELNSGMIKVSSFEYKREFYTPKYHTEELLTSAIPDYRKTMHWEPNIQVDASGEAVVEFYHSDQSAEVSVVVEGIAHQGLMGSSRTSYKVN